MQSTLLEQENQAVQTKKCPFCAEQIQREAIKCRYCGEFLDHAGPLSSGAKLPGRERPGPKWYFSPSTLVVALLCLGPLALPLAWVNPRYKGITKLLITLAVIALTMILCQVAMNTYRNVMEQVKALGL